MYIWKACRTFLREKWAWVLGGSAGIVLGLVILWWMFTVYRTVILTVFELAVDYRVQKELHDAAYNSCMLRQVNDPTVEHQWRAVATCTQEASQE